MSTPPPPSLDYGYPNIPPDQVGRVNLADPPVSR
jgi:hypothetical protein